MPHDAFPNDAREVALQPPKNVDVEDLEQPRETGRHAHDGECVWLGAQGLPHAARTVRAGPVPDPADLVFFFCHFSMSAPSI